MCSTQVAMVISFMSASYVGISNASGAARVLEWAEAPASHSLPKYAALVLVDVARHVGVLRGEHGRGAGAPDNRALGCEGEAARSCWALRAQSPKKTPANHRFSATCRQSECPYTCCGLPTAVPDPLWELPAESDVLVQRSVRDVARGRGMGRVRVRLHARYPRAAATAVA